jgi:hypothetical protein
MPFGGVTAGGGLTGGTSGTDGRINADFETSGGVNFNGGSKGPDWKTLGLLGLGLVVVTVVVGKMLP